MSQLAHVWTTPALQEEPDVRLAVGWKRADRPYRAGRSPDWIKVKNRKHPAMSRVMDSFY